MKFCKKYEEYMEKQCQNKKLPRVGIKKLKKILKRCRRCHQSTHSFASVSADTNSTNNVHDSSTCSHHQCTGLF